MPFPFYSHLISPLHICPLHLLHFIVHIIIYYFLFLFFLTFLPVLSVIPPKQLCTPNLVFNPDSSKISTSPSDYKEKQLSESVKIPTFRQLHISCMSFTKC